jgi:uncharacterized membrane protein YphA (DoxX/SURF4 family)
VTAQRSSQGRAAKPGTPLPAARRTAARRTGKGGRSERDRSTRLEAGWRDAVASRAARAAELIAAWAPTAARVLLGLVLAWFGYHELVQPGLWTGYVPLIQPQSAFAIVLVLAHGWLLLMLAVALVAGIMARAAAVVAAVLLLEIVVSLTVTGGLSDLTLRDVGVLGLAIMLTSPSEQRLMLTREQPPRRQARSAGSAR